LTTRIECSQSKCSGVSQPSESSQATRWPPHHSEK